MAGPSRLKLVGLVEGMCPNVLAQEFFRSVNCEPWGYVALHVALVRHIYLIRTYCILRVLEWGTLIRTYCILRVLEVGEP